MNKAERLQAVQNIISNIENNNSHFVDSRVLLPALLAIKEDLQERYTPEELNPNSEHYNPLNLIRNIQS